MNKRLGTTVILFLAVCVTLCSCDGVLDSPLGDVEIPPQPSVETIRIYICGAVENEGYYETVAGANYMDVLRLAGLLSQSVLPTLNSSFVDGKITKIIVNYYDGETACDSINVNNAWIAARMPVKGLSEEVVNKLADYIELNGKIANQQQLKLALGQDYADNFYKLFVAEDDYEEVN